MESVSSILVAIGAAVPAAHFVYTLVRDFCRLRRDRPRVRLFVTVRRRADALGIPVTMKRLCVANVSTRTVCVVEVRTSRDSGVGVIDVDGGQRDIAPGCADDFPLPAQGRFFRGDVFVELGTGEVFALAI